MAMIRPVNLGAPATTIGAQTQVDPLLAAALLQQRKAGADTAPPSAGPDYQAMAAALQGTPQVTGGTWGEAIADALAGGIRGRAEHDERLAADKQTARQNQWQEALQAHQQSDWNDADKQQERLTAWAGTQDPEAQVDPAGAFQAHRLATAPLTREQQATLDLSQARFGEEARHNRAEEGIGWINAQNRGGGGLTRLRGADDRQLTRIQQGGEQGRALEQYANQFEAANRTTGSGPIGQFTQYFSGDQSAMRQSSSLMRGLMRPVGSGSTSDFEQRLYAQGAPEPGLPGPANQVRIDNIRTLAALSNARQFFYENYAEATGTLRGAEQAFQASQEFQQLARPRQSGAPQGGASQPSLTNANHAGPGQLPDPLGIRH